MHNHHAIGAYGSVDLYSYGILFAPEFFNLQMLLQPFEEQLYLPPVVIKVCNLQRVDIQSIGEEDELPVRFGVK